MSLAAGRRLGPYEILGLLGAGGMGEVYRARDTRLNRTVALKVLPAGLADRQDLRERFEREARAVSSLNHPHICTLYDVGHQDGVDFLVMEHLEGETLEHRIDKGPLPTDLVLRYGGEISDALDKAHRQGVVHRDLKPGNIMLTNSGVKLLDFGLAKLSFQPTPIALSNVSALATERPKNLTAEGMILGTIQYMAPEQLEGRDVDARTDVFALGSVVYEMATGRKAFAGKSQASVISAILASEPMPISHVRPMSPATLDHVVKKCLAKDPEDRWQTARDVRSELKWIAEGGAQTGAALSPAPRRKARRALWMLNALLLPVVAALVIAGLYRRLPTTETRLIRFIIPAPTSFSFQGSMTLSPDGRQLAFTATAGGQSSLWVHSFDSLSPRILPATGGASSPFWSPDGRWIAFFAEGKLKKIEASGGPPQVLCAASDSRGGTWNRDGVILFSPSSTDGLYRVSAAGGTAEQFTTLDTSKGEASHRWPSFLPNGHHFLYFVDSGNPDDRGIFAGSIDSNVSKRLLGADSSVLYAPPGYLIFVSQGTLMSQPFDAASLQLKGQPVRLAEQVWTDAITTGFSAFSVSDNGTLVYRTGGTENTQFAWFDRNGNRLGAIGSPGRYGEPSISPDENRIVFENFDLRAIGDLWSMDLSGGNLSRLTFDASDDGASLWSPSGDRIVWASSRSGTYDLYQKPASGGGQDELLLKSATPKYPDDWSADGRFILYESIDPKTKFDLWVLPMSGDRKPIPYLRTEFNETHSRFSPDGRWIAYESDESGRSEVYVQGFPSTGGKWQVSNGGGDQPYWRRDGKELFYISPDGKLMAGQVSASAGTFQIGVPKALFAVNVPPLGITGARNHFIAAADGRRFLINGPIEDTASTPITVVLDWTALLRSQ